MNEIKLLYSKLLHTIFEFTKEWDQIEKFEDLMI